MIGFPSPTNNVVLFILLFTNRAFLSNASANTKNRNDDLASRPVTDLAIETLQELFLAQKNKKLTYSTAADDDQVILQQQQEIQKLKELQAQRPPQAVAQEQQQIAAQDKEDKNRDYTGEDLIEWIRDNGGQVHENARIGLDPTGSYRGVFVAEDSEGIEEEDIICRIPWKLLVKPEDYDPTSFWNCDAIQELYHQFTLGDESPYAPYIKYLLDQPTGRIPAAWSHDGQELLQNILGHPVGDLDHSEEGRGIPPFSYHKSFEKAWLEECNGTDTPLARAAFFQFTSRDEDTLMVPFYDMCNHSNDPNKLNTISSKPRMKYKPFVLRATRDINPGEEIYVSYNRCNRCWFDETYEDCLTYSFYDTSNIFEVFGFVEDLPQSWSFPMGDSDDDDDEDDSEDEDEEDEEETFSFCLEREEETGTLLVQFGDNFSEIDEVPNDEERKFLDTQLRRLKRVKMSLKADRVLEESIPRYEWEMAWNYHEALMVAISSAILAAEDGGFEDEDFEDEDLEYEDSEEQDLEYEDFEEEGESDEL